MLKKGRRGFIYKVLPVDKARGVTHELAGDQEVTRFKIAEGITDKDGKVVRYPDGNPAVVYILVTVYLNLPLLPNDKIRLLDYNDLVFMQMFNAREKRFQTFYSISAKIEKIEKKETKEK
jgi:hypothetical protein